MKAVRLWAIGQSDKSGLEAQVCDGVKETATEQQLEELLVSSPDLLEDGLKLVTRQSITAGGPLDLLGVDHDGRLVVFELKRGSLTRDAVAQVLDYLSYLAELDVDDRAKHVERYSGANGIEPIKDFRAWYQEEFNGDIEALALPPRAVLVGLGVDDKARRMVEFLSAQSVPVELLTFHAFRHDGKLFLARQVEVLSKESVASTDRNYTKAQNQEMLVALADEHQCRGLLDELREALVTTLDAFVWPNATCYSIVLPERTDSGNLSYRNYVSVFVDETATGRVWLAWNPRAWVGSREEFAGTATRLGFQFPPAEKRLSLSLDAASWQAQKADWLALTRIVRTRYEASVKPAN